MVKLHFRVHYSQVALGAVQHWSLEVPQWIIDNTNVTRCIIGKEEDAARPHYQIYIEFTKTLSTFR